MFDLKRILVPTDFTDTSERALDWAMALASRLGASVTLLHAYEIPIIGFPDGSLLATPEIASRLADASRSALNASVAKALAKAAGSGVALDSVLREGATWEEINAVAEALDVGLIVLGTHGRRGLARALLGSVAEDVIRTATRPVVTLRDPAHAPKAHS